MNLELAKEMDRRSVLNWLYEVYNTPSLDKEKRILARDAIVLLAAPQEAKAVIQPYFKACSKGESLYGTCPECRHRIIEKSNFCGNCGQAVIWAKKGE